MLLRGAYILVVRMPKVLPSLPCFLVLLAFAVVVVVVVAGAGLLCLDVVMESATVPRASGSREVRISVDTTGELSIVIESIAPAGMVNEVCGEAGKDGGPFGMRPAKELRGGRSNSSSSSSDPSESIC